MNLPLDTLMVETPTVACDGASATLEPSLGHPRVFLKLKNGKATCPYCSRTFVQAPESATTTAH